MKKRVLNLVLVLLITTLSISSCKQSPPFGDAGKQAVRDTINLLMKKVTAYAETANVDSTFTMFSDDSNAMFMSQGSTYNKAELLARYKVIYQDIKSQKIDVLKQEVMVFSPESAAWIAYAKGDYVTKSGQTVEQYLAETWIWQRHGKTWKIVSNQESWLALPGETEKTNVTKALADLAKLIVEKSPKPDDMPALLKEFLKKNTFIYGSTLAFIPTEVNGKKLYAAPYIYRAGNEFKEVRLPDAYDYTGEEWYKGPVQTKAPYWCKPYFDAGGGNVVMITYSIPVYDKGNKMLGVLTSDLELK
ncbi:MAG: DUF4440 domain-containing protein [Bacteroidota bacterium]